MPLMVGRDAELADVMGLFNDGTQIAAVSCEPAKGLSTFLVVVEDRASEAGWRVLHLTAERAADRLCSAASVERHLRRLFDLPEGTEEGRVRRALSRFVPGQVSVYARALAEGGRTLMVIDGYEGSLRFDFWLRSLTGDLNALGASVVVLVGGRPGAIEPIRADRRVELGALDTAAVRTHLEEAAALLSPPLSDDELTAYVTAGVEEPGVVAALDFLFELVSQEGPTWMS